jgi:cellulose synthase/poly-beta-1,6-N-acetylglucosamine synthase-like glycosyltransferase
MMSIALSLFITSSVLLSGIGAVAATVLLIEVIASLTKSKPYAPSNEYPSVAVLVPAHNEGSGLLPTLAGITAQLRKEDRCLVVADNCSDDTAAVAKRVGVEVIERFDQTRIGKGYALDYGIRHLQSSAPAILIIIDADCTISETAISILAISCHQSGRPTQALDLMVAPDDAPPILKVSEFAWRLKNQIRPLGLKMLGLPCQLMGTGMAFPWAAINAADIASDHIVEDLKLGVDLAEAGYPALFCRSAVVTSIFPTDAKAARQQRQRWEQGHLHTIVWSTPRLLAKAALHRRVDLLAIALDLLVPPLSVLGSLLFFGLVFSSPVAIVGKGLLPLTISVIGCLELLAALIIAWWWYGRELLPVGSLHLILRYSGGKIAMYMDFLSHGGTSRWIRTDRK